MKTIIEPFRIEMVEPIWMTTRAERDRLLRQAHYNPFLILAEAVQMELLNDVGCEWWGPRRWYGTSRRSSRSSD